ncbi:hypothetical protein FNV43_RR21023 [Rhamnella rubrinervis]|uniref:Potassium transporter n=1 Tax=Rhamnella rubrinervis TaxID=2594499 RepID=A0A8K0E7M3_9ROSA|nr:hypothetical protein FNV43_RR21023 [Rhamnella rubrinervis]
MASAPSNKIERAHQMYREGRYGEALGFYTEALSMAKTKPQRIALHSNRAACYLKLHDFKKAAEECTSVLDLDHDHTGALMLRAQTLVTLREYHTALFDVNRLIDLNPSSEVYQNLQARLRTQLFVPFVCYKDNFFSLPAQGKSLAPIPESEAELEEEEEEEEYDYEEEPKIYGEKEEEYGGEEEEKYDGEKDLVVAYAGIVQDAVSNRTAANADVISHRLPKQEELSRQESDKKVYSVRSPEQERDQKINSLRTTTAEVVAPQTQQIKELSDKDPKGWQAIPKPKGHSSLDYARWDRVEDDSSEEEDDEDDDDESQPQFRFRVKTVGVRTNARETFLGTQSTNNYIVRLVVMGLEMMFLVIGLHSSVDHLKIYDALNLSLSQKLRFAIRKARKWTQNPHVQAEIHDWFHGRHVESGNVTYIVYNFYKATLCLAYQSLGVVYGDLSITPIYVYKSTFSGNLQLFEEDHEILGVLSLVFWTLTLIPLCKYIIFVLGADENGEGGTFALYTLLCQNSRVGLLSTAYLPHERISSHNSETSTRETRTSLLMKEFFERYKSSRIVLLLVVLLGTSMVIGDGILTPSMSVLSAVYGIQTKVTGLHENYCVLITCIILVGLFTLQHFGTHRIGFLFAPIMVSWLLCVGGLGIYNVFRWNPRVICALSPYYIYNFFKITGRDGWHSLGGIVLCLAGAEAMFADLGHFSQLSIRIAFTGLVYPCLVLAYMGEAAYLSKHKMDLHSSFYKAIPGAIFWPVFVIATLATVVGSQAIISATFSIISQSRALRCFPRVKIKHTSNQIHGQIYIPEANWMLMLLCLLVVIGFKDTNKIGNAYGLAAIIVTFITTCLMFFVISMVWKRNVLLAFLFVAMFGSVEMLYISSCLAKVHKGGWLPLLISLVVMSLMSFWLYGTSKKDAFELQNKVSLDRLLSLNSGGAGITRVAGICLVYSNLTSGLPPMFAHFVTNFPAFHRILMFVTLKFFMVPKVPASERFVISRIGAPELRLFHCIVRYGYKDVKDSYDFENNLIEKVAEFLKQECNSEEMIIRGQSPVNTTDTMGKEGAGGGAERRRKMGFPSLGSNEEAVKELMEAKEAGVAYMIGNTCVVASKTSSFMKKIAIDVFYGFLRRNSRRPATGLGIPSSSLIEVRLLYRV